MRICVVSDEHYPYQGPDTEVVVNTAAALGAARARVELIVPRLWAGHRSPDDVCAFYGVRPTFRLVRLPCALPPSRRLRVEKLTHAASAVVASALKEADVVHTRDVLALLLSHLSGLPWCFETYRRHAAERPWLPRVLRRAGLGRGVGAVAHNEACRQDLITLGFAPEAVLTAHVGFARHCQAVPLDPCAARRRCGLELPSPVVGYVGNVGPSKGVDQLLDIAERLPRVSFLVVGGAPPEVGRLRAETGRRRLDNVTFVGHRPAAEAPAYLYAADVLISPAIHRNTYFQSSTVNRLLPQVLPGTPMKLFNYLAVGRPIVSADQPHMREVLRENHTALMFPPTDAAAGAGAIRRLLDDATLARRLADNGRNEAERYTWDARGRKMLEFFESRLSRKP